MEALLVLFGLMLIGGYVIGIVGFFRAASAHVELRDLRRAMVDLNARLQAGGHAPVDPEALPTAAFQSTAPPPEPALVQSLQTPALQTPALQTPALQTPPPQNPPPPTPPPWAEPPARPKPPRDLEALLTMRWGVWLGSAALLLAGVFLVRYAADEGLLGPATRCVAAALLGVALLAGSEWLFRHAVTVASGPFRSDQAPAALAAGGSAVLFGAAYGIGPFYDLVPPLVAFVGMAAASFVALGAALRYGQLVAAVGIVGGFVTPALVATDNPSLPGLFAYLLIVTAAALAVVRYTAWTWLGWATTLAGALWVLAVGGAREPGAQGLSHLPDLWAAAAFLPAAAALTLFLLPPVALEHPIGRRLAWVPFTVLALTGLILLGLDPGVMTRMALFVLSPVAVWKAALEPRLDRMTWIAALFGLLTLLFWELPPWNPTGEPVVIEGVVQAILPGAWAPEAIRPLIFAGVLFAAFHVAAGLWFERRAPRPLHWSALTAAVPVLVLIVLYGHIARFQSSIVWALTALALAAALTGTTAYATLGAAAEGGKQRAGVHAAGAAAALALGCAIMLRQQWLSLAIALFLPALAWIEAQTDLPALRRLALVVAIVVLIRLLGNWYVLDYDYGGTRIANGLIAAYAAPAVLFGVSALLFRRRADDLLVAVLEGGAASLAGVFLSLEIRHWFRGTDLEGPASFLEMALHVLTLGAQASIWLRVARRSHRPILDWAWRILGGLALAGSIGLLVFNPLMTNASAGTVALLIAYVAPAGLAFLARQQLADPGPRRLLGGYALAAGFVWITAQIRVAFHPDHPGLFFRPVEDAELWAWSGAWMLYGMGLMAVGIRLRDRLVRLAALGVIGLVCAKVFLVDMSGLTGLWRVLSFLGLGLALIGLGTVYRRFMLPVGPAMVEPVGPPMPEDPPPAV